MKIGKKITILFLAVLASGNLISWGVWGHKHISHAAVFALPQEMTSFFYNHIDYITEESVVPDIRKYTMNDKAEFTKHFIDIEGFEKTNIDSFPKTIKEATTKYGDVTLQKYGILPWHIQDMMGKLTKAFEHKNKTEILFIAGDLAHYLADANMPLHTSINHNGQLTDQKGIHGFWESQLPEMFGNKYNFNVGKAEFINDIDAEIWKIIKNSHALADELLLIERNTKATFDKDKIYKKTADGNLAKTKYKDQIYSKEYAEAFHTAMNGMVEKQLRHSIKDISNFWFTAWVNAGKPNLAEMDSGEVTQSNQKNLKKELKLMEKGQLIPLDILREY